MLAAAAIETLSATFSQHARAADAPSGRAIAASPDDASLYRTRASLEEALGRDQAALDDHEQAYEKSDGEDPEALIAALRRAIASSANDPSKDVQGRAATPALGGSPACSRRRATSIKRGAS